MNKVLGNNAILLCSALGNNQNQACSVLGKANTHEKSLFRMPNCIFSKGATPMNSSLERTMYTSKSYADFAMQKSFKDRNTQPDMVRCQFFEHFSLKVRCSAKSTQALDENRHLAKYAACQTLYLGKILHFQRQMFVKR